MTTTDVISRIDQTLGAATGDSVSADAMRWKPATQYAFPAVLIPADEASPARLVDLGTNKAYTAARTLIGCQLIEKVTLEGAGAISTDFLFDEEGGPFCRADARLNRRATRLGYAVRVAQLRGLYPAPAYATESDLVHAAGLWREHLRLFGTVVLVGSDERTGDWIPVPEGMVEFARTQLGGLDEDAANVG